MPFLLKDLGALSQAMEAIKTTPPDTIGPGFFGPMRLDEFVATRLVETQVHGMDLTDALGAPPLHMPRATVMAAEVLDEVLARRAVPGRPVDLEGDDLGSFGPRLGEVSTPIPASRSWGSATGELGATGLGGGRIVSGAVVGPRACGQQRSITVFSGQPQPQVDGHIGRDGAAGPYTACKRSGSVWCPTGSRCDDSVSSHRR